MPGRLMPAGRGSLFLFHFGEPRRVDREDLIAVFLCPGGGGGICYTAVAIVKEKFGYDDSLDAFGIHGIGGMWGAIATGLWATTAVNPDGANGLFYGETNLFVAQVISIGVAIVFAVIGSAILYKVVSSVVAVRADENEEILGLDITEHGERGYNAGLFAGAPSFISDAEAGEIRLFPSVSGSDS